MGEWILVLPGERREIIRSKLQEYEKKRERYSPELQIHLVCEIWVTVCKHLLRDGRIDTNKISRGMAKRHSNFDVGVFSGICHQIEKICKSNRHSENKEVVIMSKRKAMPKSTKGKGKSSMNPTFGFVVAALLLGVLIGALNSKSQPPSAELSNYVDDTRLVVVENVPTSNMIVSFQEIGGQRSAKGTLRPETRTRAWYKGHERIVLQATARDKTTGQVLYNTRQIPFEFDGKGLYVWSFDRSGASIRRNL